jgi:hypothetical protein
MAKNSYGDETENRITIVHFIGVGRSGSTLLNIILDNHPDIVSTGELAFFVRGWLSGDYCSCNHLVSECLFWSKVKDEWLKRTNIPDLESYLYLQQQWESFRRLPFVLFRSFLSNQAFREYQQYTAQLYAVIKELSDVMIVADSSKNPVRALSLATIPRIDLRLIFLVRDVRGYAWSKQKVLRKNQKKDWGKRKPLYLFGNQQLVGH